MSKLMDGLMESIDDNYLTDARDEMQELMEDVNACAMEGRGLDEDDTESGVLTAGTGHGVPEEELDPELSDEDIEYILNGDPDSDGLGDEDEGDETLESLLADLETAAGNSEDGATALESLLDVVLADGDDDEITPEDETPEADALESLLDAALASENGDSDEDEDDDADLVAALSDIEADDGGIEDELGDEDEDDDADLIDALGDISDDADEEA